MNKIFATLLGLILAIMMVPSVVASPACAPWLDHDLKQLHSKKPLDLCEATQGKTLLLVNTASHCGFTGQFDGLEQLHQEYQHQGLVIIGFPSNAFDQAADNEAAAAKVCYVNFGVTFLMSQPIEVTGTNAHPIFQHLNQQQGQPSWNFNKYLVDKHGHVIDRYSQWTSPGSWFLSRAIDKLL
jgi:glutathione peroxidase